ncbi:Sulfite reductase [ferredoxin] [Symmachiella dynata]|uniref:NADPH-dependent assimilatory sulfite reductase hemoprotein subunit n=1 Tax=Symmachiella dynata TaxID=2527995 RepID=UPI00118A4031|nr:NADPH-dependent assimilatory sulfite reductase hemoprotein subunit [Symmachiella dynata]QDT48786.1 Sulfite reductase [ferredoxin] [Symmachiella dynata]
MATDTKTDKASKPSKIEVLKEASQQLRGTIAEELAASEDHFTGDALQLLKFHGSYQQDNRDERGQKNEDGSRKGKSYSCMVRTRIPGGKVSAAQFLAELDLCEKYGNGTVRVTTRQGFQLHGVLKDNIKETIRAINDSQLTTFCACGDVERNVMCCPAPHKHSPVHDQMQALCDAIAEHLKPKTTSYYDIWLTDEAGEKTNATAQFQPVEEPIYGKTYLPRKFKTCVTLPEDNCVDIHSNDLGFLAIVEGDEIVGYNVLVGGGMGATPSAKKTFPYLAKPMAFVTPEQAVDVAEAVVKVQRDFGNRSDRKIARLKYLIADWGVEKFKTKVEEYYGQALPDPRPVVVTDVDDHLGWHEQGDGKWFVGINVPSGRIQDLEEARYKTGLRTILEKYGMETRLTAMQSVLLCDIEAKDRDDITAILVAHGITAAEEMTPFRRLAIACPAWPTCGLAITESERALPSLIEEFEAELARQDLTDERISLHMTGCPNGCARPYTPDIGLVGKAAGEKYTLYLGGNAEGTRLAFIYEDMVPSTEIVPKLSPLFTLFKEQRNAGESFGDFCDRLGQEELAAVAAT